MEVPNNCKNSGPNYNSNFFVHRFLFAEFYELQFSITVSGSEVENVLGQ